MSDYRPNTEIQSDIYTRDSAYLYGQIALIAASAFALFSFVLAMFPYQQMGFVLILAAQPGRFLYNSFHYAGVLVPLVLYITSLSLRSSRFRLDWLVMAVLSFMPMATAAIALRIVFSADIAASPSTAFVNGVFGEGVGIWLTVLLTLLLTLTIARIGRAVAAAVGAPAGGAGREEYAEREESESADYADAADVYDDAADEARTALDPEIMAGPAFNRLVLSRPPQVPAEQPEAAQMLEQVGDSAAEYEDEIELGDIGDEGEGEIIADSGMAEEFSSEIEYALEVEPDTGDEADFEAAAGPEPEPAVIHVSFPRPPAGSEPAGTGPEQQPEPVLAPEPPADSAQPGLVEPAAPEIDFADYEDELEDDEVAAEPEEDEFEEQERDARVLAESPPPTRITRGRYNVPVDGLLNHYENNSVGVIGPESEAAAEALKETLKEFNIEAEVTGIRRGPVITMFEILPAPGVKLAKITSLADNIALRLAAQSVRIVAPIPGKHAVGIEIPNQKRSLVSFGELLIEDDFTSDDAAIPLAIGRDIPGDAQIVDLAKTPHLLIAGATGSGKSVCVNSIICSILYRRAPEDVRMILIDPKIVELKFYNDIPHLLTPVITDPKRAFQALQYAIYEMERRYSLLDAMGVRDIGSYNRKIKDRKLATANLPYIVIVVDEFADLMATSGKELESTVARLCAMSRAVGIHLVLATQRPSTDVITGLIKANIPSRIAFMVASKVDSRIIIDNGGAEKLLGRGDMLFTSAWDPFPFRMQGAFLSEDEVERVVSHVKTLGEPDYIDDEIFIDEDDEDYVQPELEDPLMEKAVDIVVSANKASASYLQRRLKIGYNRAARLVEEMERIGIVGPQNGSKARDVIGVPQDVY